MKKNLVIITMLATMAIPSQAKNLEDVNIPDTTSVNQETITPTIKLSASYDWVNMSQIQRDEKIATYQHMLFIDNRFGVFRKEDWNNEFKPFFKDNNRKEHYRQAKNGVQELQDAYLCAFYTKSGLLISYAVQYKKDMKHAYYYDGYGNLRFIDVMSDNYPEFPYYSKQYKKNGKLVSAIVFEDKDTQYMYKPNEEFKGLWLKEKMFDKNGKQLMTRTNW